jgi:hypothetical protein
MMNMYACHNRAPFKRTLTVQDGYKPDGTRHMIEVPFTMSPHCEYTTTELGRFDSRCVGCKHKAQSLQLEGIA